MPDLDTELLIRRATQADAPALVRFNCALARGTEGLELLPEVVSRGVARLLADPSLGFYLVAEQGGQVVGSLLVTTEWSDWRNGVFWWIQSVYVEKHYRRKGIYRRLYRAVQEHAAAREDVCGFRLYVEQENLRAQQTYASLGMSKTHYLVFEELKEDIVFCNN